MFVAGTFRRARQLKQARNSRDIARSADVELCLPMNRPVITSRETRAAKTQTDTSEDQLHPLPVLNVQFSG